MIKLKNIIRPALIGFTVLLTACAANINHLVVTPDILISANNLQSIPSLNISTNDLRTAQHVLQIIKEGEGAKLLTSQSSLAGIIDTSVKSAFKKAGAQLTPMANNSVTININNALINVNQSMMKYTANNVIALSVVINNGTETLTKSYKTSGKSNGPLQADIAVLERDFTQQLSKLLANIVTDPQLIEFMR